MSRLRTPCRWAATSTQYLSVPGQAACAGQTSTDAQHGLGAMVATLYGTGLRVSEMCALRIEDIDSKRMQLRVLDAKTGQHYARLTPAVLKGLRAYYR
jgi:site-specific recombinase XerD